MKTTLMSLLLATLLATSPLAIAADTWGAIAYSPFIKNDKGDLVGAYSSNHASRKVAKKQARDSCQDDAQTHGVDSSNCFHKVKNFKNSCAALYYDPIFREYASHDDVRDLKFTIKFGSDVLIAKRKSREICQRPKKKGYQCKLVIALCSDGSNIEKPKNRKHRIRNFLSKKK